MDSSNVLSPNNLNSTLMSSFNLFENALNRSSLKCPLMASTVVQSGIYKLPLSLSVGVTSIPQGVCHLMKNENIAVVPFFRFSKSVNEN